MEEKKNRGGARKGAGREALGNKGLTLGKNIKIRNDDNVDEIMALLKKTRDEFYKKLDENN